MVRDAFGGVLTTTYPNGEATTHERDALGRLTRVRRAGGAEIVRFEGLCGTTGWRSAIVDAYRTIRREYDGAQRMKSLVEEGPAGGTSVSRQYQYLGDVRANRVLDLVSSREDTFQFDPFGRLKEMKPAAGSSASGVAILMNQGSGTCLAGST